MLAGEVHEGDTVTFDADEAATGSLSSHRRPRQSDSPANDKSVSHHQPCLCAQRSRIREMINMINSRMLSSIQRIGFVDDDVHPQDGRQRVIGSVIAR